MIKLIASDMDGTLLKKNGEIPKEFFELYKELKEKNIKFVAASGRPYNTLYKDFKPISDELYYICDNGAYIVKKEGKAEISIIDRTYIAKIIEECFKIENIVLVLCGLRGAYHKPCSEKFLKEINKYYLKQQIVEDLNDIDDEIFKATICDGNTAEKNSYLILKPIFGDVLSVVPSQSIWLDIMNKNIGKGYGLEKIQKDLNIAYEETMVFGDYYNDIEMLKKGKYSFVVNNGNKEMEQYGKYITKSNEEEGVLEAIKKYIINNEKLEDIQRR